jgi:hypothetical protein
MTETESLDVADIGIRHYKTGRDSWKVGFRHYWLRIRGLITGLAIMAATMGVPWWWQDDWKWQPIPSAVTLSVNRVAASLSSIALLLLVAVFIYARRRAQRSIECKDKLHAISHVMRDAYCDLLARTGARKSKHDILHEKRHLLDTSSAIAKSIVDYYKALTGASCVSAVIRLAEDPPEDGKNEAWFVAVGRAGSTDHTRGSTSEPIPMTEGIPKLFKSDKIGASGVLFIHDLDKAIRYGAYKETKNEKTFPNDYECVIAIPLNGYNGQRKDLIGLLTITGRARHKLLRVQHIDLLKAIGDRLAEHYSAVIARLSASSRMPELHPPCNYGETT